MKKRNRVFSKKYSKRKTMRQLSFHQSTHFILRLREGLPTFFEPRDQKLRQHIFRIAEKYKIRVYDLVLNHSHMHSVLLLPNRKSYVRFVRELTSFITNYFEKCLSIPWLKLKRIFSSRPFARSVPWGRAYEILIRYMRKNEAESGYSQPLVREKVGARQLCFYGDG